MCLYQFGFRIACFFALFAGVSTHAICPEKVQNLDVDTLRQFSWHELLDVKVAVASKSLEEVFDASASVSVFTRQDIRAMGVDSVEALLNFVPGFSSSRESVFGDGYMVAARGRTTPQASYNILFMLDGQALNNDRSGGALTAYRFIPLHNVEQVEIIRGPGSALYGSSAFSGVVNIITADNLNEAYVGVGNLDAKHAYLNVSEGGEDWHAMLSMRYFEDEGQDYAEVSDPRQGNDIYAKLCYQDLTVFFQHAQWDLDDFYIENGTQGYLQPEQMSLRLKYALVDTEVASLTLHSSYSVQHQESLHEELSAETIRALPTTLVQGSSALFFGFRSKEREWRIGLEGRYRLNEQHELFMGMDWRQAENVFNRSLFNYRSEDFHGLFLGSPTQAIVYANGDILEGPALTPEGTRRSHSLYVQDKYRFNDQWAATLGLRYDHYSDFGSSSNPRFSLRYTPTAHSSFKLLYGEAFRAPSVRQLRGIIGNPELKPEKVRTLELAWLQKYGSTQTTLVWFHSEHSHIIDTRLSSNGFERQFQNVEDNLRTAGWEIEAVTQPWHDLSLRAAYSYLYKTEQNPRRFPRQTASLIANYHWETWNFNLNAYYHSDVEQPTRKGNQRLAGFWHLGAHVQYEFNPHLTLSFSVDNLLDEDYYSSVKSLGFTEGLMNRGRTYVFGLRYAF